MNTIVLKGDIIKSRGTDASVWLPAFKDLLAEYAGTEAVHWFVYEGDTFIIEVIDTSHAIDLAVLIKAWFIGFKNLNARIAIGVGNVSFKGDAIMEANGTAYSRAGDTLKTLKDAEQTLKVESGNPNKDKTLNLLLQWLSSSVDHWNIKTAQAYFYRLAKPKATQAEIADQMKIKSQSVISEHLSRGGGAVIFNTLSYFSEEFTTLS